MTEIERVERAITELGKYRAGTRYAETAIEALNEKLHRLENKPLTLEQLKNRVGKPVFIKHMWHDWSYDGWAVVEQFEASQFGESMRVSFGKITLDNYNICWLAYDHEPERSQ